MMNNNDINNIIDLIDIKSYPDIINKKDKEVSSIQVDPVTKFVVDSEEYNNYYFPKIEKKETGKHR